LYAQVGKSLTALAELSSLPFHCSSKECLFWNSPSEIYRFIKPICPFISFHFVWYVTKKLNIICISAFTANIPSDIPVLLLEVTSKVISNDLRLKPIHTLSCYLILQRSATARPVSRSSVASENLIRSQINLFWICGVLIGHRKSFLCVRPISPFSPTPHI